MKIQQEILDKRGIVIVIGGTDTGKTTFCRDLANSGFRLGLKVAIVDCDLGQSSIGPPGTIGLGFLENEINSIEEIPVHSLYFVGSISPLGHFLPTIVGTKKLVEEAKEKNAQLTIIDTSGFIDGPGKDLKYYKIDLINPDHIVAMQNEDELESLLSYLENPYSIYRLSVPEKVKKRTIEERRTIRETKFKKYFKNAKNIDICSDKVSFLKPLPEKENLLVAFIDENNEVLDLGIILSYGSPQATRRGGANEKKIITAMTPLNEIDKIKRIQFGEIRIENIQESG